MSDDSLLPPDIKDEIPQFLEKELRKQSRDPFVRALQRMLQHRPSQRALQALAERPDKWAQAVSVLASLAGFEKGVNVTLRLQPVEQMTDADLLDEYRKQQGRVAALARGLVGQDVTDAEVLPPLPAPAKQEEEKK